VKDCNAKCDLPNIYDNMAGCPECDNWFHYHCAAGFTKSTCSVGKMGQQIKNAKNRLSGTILIE
jgi:hypothetical protein